MDVLLEKIMAYVNAYGMIKVVVIIDSGGNY